MNEPYYKNGIFNGLKLLLQFKNNFRKLCEVEEATGITKKKLNLWINDKIKFSQEDENKINSYFEMQREVK